MSQNQPRLALLLERLRAHCEAQRGRKAELAKYLDVRPHHVSLWLKGTAPGAEYVLGILEWLEKEGAL